MVPGLHTFISMVDSKESEVPGHIETLRLFDASRGDLVGLFQLEASELKHLESCKECQHVREVFGRQFTALKPKAA